MDGRRLDVLARQRGNVLALSDAPALGMTRTALDAHARRHHWLRPAPGVVVLPGTQMDYQRAVLVVFRATGGSRVLVGGLAAAWLWGMIRRPPSCVDLRIPMDRHAPKVDHLRVPVDEAGVRCVVTARVRQSRTLLMADRAVRGIVPVTGPARTAVDLAADLTTDDLRSLVIDARQRRVLTLTDIRRVHERIATYPGRRRMARVLRDLDEQTCDSWLEWDFRKELRRRGLRPYPRPFPFRCSDGVVIEIDVAFPAQWVAVECDGWGSHAERTSLTRHHLRQNRAVVDGWRPFAVDWTRLKHDTDRLCDELMALLERPLERPRAQAADPADVDARFRGRRR